MNKILLSSVILVISFFTFSQELHLKNVLVIGQFDRPEDRYAVEVNVTELLNNAGVKALPSLNVLKQGTAAIQLASDSIQNVITQKGFDTYLIVNVRGYDRKFKPSQTKISFEEMLNMASIYHIYRDEATSVSFEFTFFKNNEVIYRDIVRCGNISNRDSVIKKFRKKLPKQIEKRWKV
jgi:hypothetical protein